jgi:hypothetical protein
MGCGSSKGANHRAEAEAYNKRKTHGFKDPGLEKHREDCVKQKKHLHHVQDPDVKRKQKQKQIHTKQQKTAKGPGGLTQNEIQAQRNKLKHRR